MVDILKLAEAVAGEIGEDCKAEVMFAPELDLKGIKEKRIIVVPSELGIKPVSRGSSEDSLKDCWINPLPPSSPCTIRLILSGSGFGT